jgi:phosphoglycerate dehydrogenase-like enzyme
MTASRGFIMRPPRILLAPHATRTFLAEAVLAGGGTVVTAPEDADAVVWTSPRRAAELRTLLNGHPNIRWVQLPWAGIEHLVDALDDKRCFTAGQGVYAREVAEHALALVLACRRDLKLRARATGWQEPSGLTLWGARVTLFGAGGIAQAFAALLAPFEVKLTVVRRKPVPPPFAADRVLGLADRIPALAVADAVVLALALTPETEGIIGAAELEAMKPSACLINVARGKHVDTAALVTALQQRTIHSAALDVTDPEPLPEGHPLFGLDNCLITPHCANTPEMAVPVLSARVTENVRRFARGEPLLGRVDVEAGY